MNVKQRTLTTTSLLVLAVLFVTLTILGNSLLRGWRVDLTENGLYTLSEGTRDTLAKLEEPVNLYFFFSEAATRDLPWLRLFAQRVRELLEEYALYGGGKIKLQFIDPQPFSEEEERATGLGLQAVPGGPGGENIYFGLAGTNTLDDVKTIAFFQPDKEAFLEYDLSKLIYSLAHPKKPVIGLLSSLPMDASLDPMTQRMGQPWVVTEQIRQLFEIRTLDPGIESVDTDIDALMLVHPTGLGETTLYAIDQYVLGGGRALIFVDPQADASLIGRPSPQAMMASRGSNLKRLFRAWGIEMDQRFVLGDGRYALAVSSQRGGYPSPHLGLLGIDHNGLAADDAITANLDTVNLAMSGYLTASEGAETRLVPLIISSNAAMPIPAERMLFLPDPNELQRGFTPTGERYTLAGRVRGKVKSAFPDGPPGGGEGGEESSEAGEQNGAHLAESTGEISIIVAADADLLTDRLWVRTADFLGQRIADAWANNADFVINALDNLTSNSDLISIRGQAIASRPFTKVQNLEREANARFLATEQQLEAQLRETEARLAELQQSRQDDKSKILSPEQRTELLRFQKEHLEIRKQLRQVRRNLDKDIEGLGATLKLINIGLVPLLLSILALTAWWMRIRKRKNEILQEAHR